MNRRFFLLSAPLFLAGCTFRHPLPKMVPIDTGEPVTTTTYVIRRHKAKPEVTPKKKKVSYGEYPLNEKYASMYAATTDNGFPVSAVDTRRINPEYLRHEVPFHMPYKPGTIVVDPTNFFCYFVLSEGRAMRYGVGVARSAAADFQGEATIGRKAVWPTWHPTASMVQKQPQRYGHLTEGMKGGPGNPLGARALYLYRGGTDTLFRLHGTVEPWSIGKRVSSGCIRFLNQDIIDLYSRVPVGTRAVVLPHKIGLG